MTEKLQAELNALPPSPDPANFFELQMGQTEILFESLVAGKHVVLSTITLRKLEDGKAYVQVTAVPQLRGACEMAAAMCVMDRLEHVAEFFGPDIAETTEPN